MKILHRKFKKNQIKARKDLRKCGGYKLLLEQEGSLKYKLFRRINWNAIIQSVTDSESSLVFGCT